MLTGYHNDEELSKMRRNAGKRGIFESIVERITRHEGFSSHVYLDSKGFLSLGYGTTVGKVSREIEDVIRAHPDWLQAKGVGTTKTRAYAAVRDRVADIRSELGKDKLQGEVFDQLLRAEKNVLVEMAYQLGVNGLLNFKRMWTALAKEDFDTAADEMLNSRWAKQTPGRAAELAGVMRSGVL